jgi:hypothetical protein
MDRELNVAERVKSISCQGTGLPEASVSALRLMFNEFVALGIFTGGSLVHSKPNGQVSNAGAAAGATLKMEAVAAEQELSFIGDAKLLGVV